MRSTVIDDCTVSTGTALSGTAPSGTDCASGTADPPEHATRNAHTTTRTNIFTALAAYRGFVDGVT
jgi:hypothetical protein